MMEFGKTHTIDRLILGTVQLGMPYGIANASGKPDFQQARAIIAAAWASGIDQFDTAQGYGESESVLASALKELGILSQVKVFTKLHPSLDHLDNVALKRAIDQSCALFGSSLQCIMLHKEEFLQDWAAGLGEHLRDCRDQGCFASIGISVYDPAAARLALETEGIDLIQLPANILDLRHEKAGVMALAKKLGKTIIIRSVYLQGALLLSPIKLPAKIQHARPFIEPITLLAERTGIPHRELAMAFVRDSWPECKVVFGAELASQVMENAESWARPLPAEVSRDLEKLKREVPLEVLRPDLWRDPCPLVVGERLQLRRVRPSDAYGNYLQWMNDPEVTSFLESRFRHYYGEDLERYILDQIQNPSVLFLAIEESHTNRHVGNIKIGPRHPVHGTAELGFLIGDKDCWGKGYATEAVSLALHLAFKEYAVRKIVAGCYSANKAAEKVFIKNGLIKEGLMRRNCLYENAETDVILFGMLKDDWLPNKTHRGKNRKGCKYDF